MGQTWPEHLATDYAGAAVRLTTVMQDQQQYLLFGCVELYPHEIPLPPSTDTQKQRIGKARTLVSTVAVKPLSDALSWYESALQGSVIVPGIPVDVPVTTLPLASEPSLGRLVAGGEMPFALRWHATPRMHHLVPMDSPPAPIAWLGPEGGTDERRRAREWLAETLGFDLLAYDEFLFGLVLVAPNPVARSISRYLAGDLPSGGERLGVAVRARQGMSLADLHVRFREERSEGITVLQDCALDGGGVAEIDLPERCGSVGLEIVSGTRGVLAIEAPARFFRGNVQVHTEPIGAPGTVEVPGRRKGDTPAAAPIVRRELDGGFGARQPAPISAEFQVIELRMRRQSRAAEAKPEGFGQRMSGEEHLFLDNRDEARLFIRGLVARARSIVVFVDPYFDRIDLREFALSAQYPATAVRVLTGREHLGRPEGGQADQDLLAGDAFAADLQTLPGELNPFRYAVPDVRLMSEDRGWHDRFLIVDEEVWHFGHSFNRTGSDEVSMAIRLRYPADLRAWILEDFARGRPFIEGWTEMKRRRLDEMIAAVCHAWKLRDPGEAA